MAWFSTRATRFTDGERDGQTVGEGHLTEESRTYLRVVPKCFRLRWMTASEDVDGAVASGGAPTPETVRTAQ